MIQWRRVTVCPVAGSLIATTLLIVVIGVSLPFTPLASVLGFSRPPLSYFGFLIPATLAYLALVEIAKRRLARLLNL